MIKGYLVCEGPTVVEGVSITAVARISVGYAEIGGTRSFYAGKQPLYLVVSSVDGERAYTVTGQEVSIQLVVSECPALAAVLGG